MDNDDDDDDEGGGRGLKHVAVSRTVRVLNRDVGLFLSG